MALYKFRVTFEDHDEVSRDIEIKSNQTFMDLHKAIQTAIGFDGIQIASFYMSNDYWIKGKEITAAKNDKGIALMEQSKLSSFILDPHQKIYYIYDPAMNWSFYIELIKIQIKEEENVLYPRCVKIAGTAPKQHGATNLGKVSTDLDFLEEVGIDVEEHEEGLEGEEAKEDGEESEDGELDESEEGAFDEFNEKE
jgi:hypothetical protein